MSKTLTLTLNGREAAFEPGETVLDVASRCELSIPTLCHDPRLDPTGACRICLVEIVGWRRLAPACATQAEAGMVIHTENARIDRHRHTLLGLYLSDHPGGPSARPLGETDQLLELAERHGAPRSWGQLPPLRAARPGDENPYIHFDPARCILCARCTRYCDEVEGVTAITLAGRAAETTIATADQLGLLETTCEMCGGCIDTCPTGAMTEKLPLLRGDKLERPLEEVRSTCNFCGVGCQLDLMVDREAHAGRGRVVKVSSPPVGTTTNDGNLCVKGRFAYEFIDHADRLTTPMIRGADGLLHEASWEAALEAASAGLLGVKERHGPDALGFVSSSRCTMEENYLVQKLSRAVFGTNNVHQCAAT